MVYSAVLMIMLYDWPYQVYQKIGPRMDQATARERFIIEHVAHYSDRLGLQIRPAFVVGPVAASAVAFSGNAVIVVSAEMLDSKRYSDDDVRFILGHELGHVLRLDTYRFWTRWTNSAAARREIAADRIAVRVAGCAAMRMTIANHRAEFMKGFLDDRDHHPHPDQRYQEACGDFRARK